MTTFCRYAVRRPARLVLGIIAAIILVAGPGSGRPEVLQAQVNPIPAENGLAGLFAASFVAATIIPLSSEAVLFGFLKLYPDQYAAALALATLGNTLGGLTSYAIGRLLPVRIQEKLDPPKRHRREARRTAGSVALHPAMQNLSRLQLPKTFGNTLNLVAKL